MKDNHKSWWYQRMWYLYCTSKKSKLAPRWLSTKWMGNLCRLGGKLCATCLSPVHMMLCRSHRRRMGVVLFLSVSLCVFTIWVHFFNHNLIQNVTKRSLNVMDKLGLRKPSVHLTDSNNIISPVVSGIMLKSNQVFGAEKMLVGCKFDNPEYARRYNLRGSNKATNNVFDYLVKSYGWSIHSGVHNVSDLTRPPSVMLFCDDGLEIMERLHWEEFNKLGTIIAVYLEKDLLFYRNYQSSFFISLFKKVDIVLGPYAYKVDEFFKFTRINSTCPPRKMWIPHGAAISYAKSDFNLNPIRSILLYQDPLYLDYPFRSYFAHLATSNKKIEIDYHNPIYGEYAATLTSTRLDVNIIEEIFNIGAAGSLIMINSAAKELLDILGLKEWEHFVAYDEMRPTKAIDWVLDKKNIQHVDKIRRKGREIILEHHLLWNRAKSIDKYFNEMEVKFELTGLKERNKYFCPAIMFSNKGCVEKYKKIAYFDVKS